MTNFIIFFLVSLIVLGILPEIIVFGLPVFRKTKNMFKGQDLKSYYLESCYLSHYKYDIITGEKYFVVEIDNIFFKYVVYDNFYQPVGLVIRGSKFSKYLDDLYILLEKENRIK